MESFQVDMVNKDILMELEESLILCDTSIDHKSGDIHVNQKETMKASDVQLLVKENVELTYTIRNHLLRGRLREFGKSLNKAWDTKKKFSKMITNDVIDDIYTGSLDNGAIGGKLLGAGGGGFFVFFVPPQSKHNLIDYLESQKLNTKPFRFESEGLVSWKIREET